MLLIILCVKEEFLLVIRKSTKVKASRTETYSEHCQESKILRFAKTVND